MRFEILQAHKLTWKSCRKFTKKTRNSYHFTLLVLVCAVVCSSSTSALVVVQLVAICRCRGRRGSADSAAPLTGSSGSRHNWRVVGNDRSRSVDELRASSTALFDWVANDDEVFTVGRWQLAASTTAASNKSAGDSCLVYGVLSGAADRAWQFGVWWMHEIALQHARGNMHRSADIAPTSDDWRTDCQ